MNKYYYNKEGYHNLLIKMKELKRKHKEHGKEIIKSLSCATGDGGTDNQGAEDMLMEEKLMINEMEILQNKIDNATIIKETKDNNKVNINDTILLKLTYEDGTSEKERFTLTGGEGDALNNKISLNSPLGKAIHNKTINDETSFIVNNKKVIVNILKKDA